MVKNLEREMFKSWGSFDTAIKLVKNAVSKKQTRRYSALIDTVTTAFYKFDEDFRFYKEEVIKKECKTEEAFNAMITEDGTSIPAYPYNDA